MATSNRCDGNFSPFLKGRSARQTASRRVAELSIRYTKPFQTSVDLTYTYGTPGQMSISFSRRARCSRIASSSRRARSTGRRSHHARPICPWRVRGARKDSCLPHAWPFAQSRTRPAADGSPAACRQRVPAEAEDRVSASHAHGLVVLVCMRRSTAMVRIAPARFRRCLRRPSSCWTGQTPAAIIGACRR